MNNESWVVEVESFDVDLDEVFVLDTDNRMIDSAGEVFFERDG